MCSSSLSNENKMNMFLMRPLEFNGAYVVLKEWPKGKTMENIYFDALTFHF